MGLIDQDYAGELVGLLASDFVSENMEEDLLAVSIRFPRERVAVMDAMAKKAGVSRNRMVNMLAAAGIQEVMSRLPGEVAGDLHDAIEGEL